VLKICSRPLPVPSQIAPVPAGFDAWFARACARNPDERFTDAKELATELRAICENPELVRSLAPRSVPPPVSAAARVEAATQPFWEKQPKVETAPKLAMPSAPPARRRRSMLPLLFVLGAVIGVVVAFRHSVKAPAPIETAAPAMALPQPPVEPLVAPVSTPAPVPPAPAPSAERAPRRGAPARTPRRAAPPAAAPVPTPAPEPPAPPPKPSADRVNLGI
jgi:serine/threonine-protein kinase